MDILTANLDITEVVLIVVVSFIGANIREYICAAKEDRKLHYFDRPQMWASTVLASIICYVINPWVVEYSPRLILLPPLLLGLAGLDIAKRISTVKGITSIAEWGLSFFGFTRKDKGEDEEAGVKDEPVPEEKQDTGPEPLPHPNPDIQAPNVMTPNIPLNMVVTPTISFAHLKSLDDMVVSVLDSICNLLVAYYATHDTETFLKGYFIIMNNRNIMDDSIREFQVIHSSTALKLSEIVKKEIELKRVYESITSEVQK